MGRRPGVGLKEAWMGQYDSRGRHDKFSLKEGRRTNRQGTEALVERGVVERKRNLLYVLHEH